MKKIKSLPIALAMTAMLTACGGGGDSTNNSLTVVPVNVAGTYQTNSNTSYIAQPASGLINFVLPATPTVGDQVAIIGNGTSNWTVQPNSGKSIRLESFGGDVGTGGLVFAPSDGLPTSAAFSSIASSSDGRYLIASSTQGIFKSEDYGKTWNISSAPKKTYYSVASSADGRHLAAVGSLTNGSGIYTSNDFGVTWSASGAPAVSYGSVTINNDGSRIAAASYDNGIYTSNDGGTTWNLATLPASAYSITASSDGAKLVAGTQSGIYSSIDHGATWVASLNSNLSFYSVTSSEDGSRIVAQANDSQGFPLAYLSTDSAATWHPLTLPNENDYLNLTISGDGNHLVISTNLNGVSISNDDGITWTQTGASKDLRWYGVAVNRDASRMSVIAGNSLGYPMYTPYAWLSGRIFNLLINNHNGIKAGIADALTLQYLGNDVWGVLNKVGKDFENY